MPAIVVTASLDVGNLVVTLAGLSFLGLGAPAPAPELGAMAARGLQFLLQQWWIPVMPGIACRAPRTRCQPVGGRSGRRHRTGCMSDLPLFLVKRLGAMIAIILVLTAIIFSLQKLSHADPVHSYLGANASKAAIAKESAILGYNKPVINQYFHYVAGLFHGDLQESLRTRRAVSTDLAAYLPATIELSLAALGMALVLGAALGLASAGRWRGASFLRVLMIAGASVPAFLLALLGVLILNGDFHLAPGQRGHGRDQRPHGTHGDDHLRTRLYTAQFATVWDGVQHLALPAFCVAIGPAVSIGRVLRGSLHSSMRSDFVRTARAKGLVERTVLFRHALRNSLSAALSMTGLQVGLMFAGVVVIETVFAWPGIGLYTDQSIPVADFPAIAGVTLVLGVFYVVINAIVDILQAVVDPRVALQ